MNSQSERPARCLLCTQIIVTGRTLSPGPGAPIIVTGRTLSPGPGAPIIVTGRTLCPGPGIWILLFGNCESSLSYLNKHLYEDGVQMNRQFNEIDLKVSMEDSWEYEKSN